MPKELKDLKDQIEREGGGKAKTDKEVAPATTVDNTGGKEREEGMTQPGIDSPATAQAKVWIAHFAFDKERLSTSALF